MPWWMLAQQQESVRPVELSTLSKLTETELGPLLAGDWLTTIGPLYARHLFKLSGMVESGYGYRGRSLSTLVGR